MTDQKRRQVLMALGTAPIAALSGCIGDDDSTDDSGNGAAGDADSDSADDGGNGISELDEDVHPTEVLDESDLESVAAEVDIHGGTQGTVRVYHNDAYIELSAGGVKTEEYFIGDYHYEVDPDGCTVTERPDRDTAAGLFHTDPFREVDPDEFWVTGTTTYNGEDVYVVETDFGSDVKMYVSSSTGWRVREEDSISDESSTVWEFHAWNEVSPIEPPEECEDPQDRDTDDDDDPDDDPDGDDEQIDGDEFAEMLSFQEQFRGESVSEDAHGTTRVQGRVDGSDQYMEIETPDGVGEVYIVDGTYYSVFDGECTIGAGDPDEDGLVEGRPEDLNFGTVTPLGDDTIDGEPVEVYEVEIDEVDRDHETETWYLDEDGFVRRIEAPDFRNDIVWESVEPISPPDMDCEEL